MTRLSFAALVMLVLVILGFIGGGILIYGGSLVYGQSTPLDVDSAINHMFFYGVW